MNNKQFPLFYTHKYHNTVLYKFTNLNNLTIPYTGAYLTIFGHIF